MTTYNVSWFAEQIGKSADWVRRNLDDIPHHRVGHSIRFTDSDLDRYLRQTAVDSLAMVTTGRRRSA